MLAGDTTRLTFPTVSILKRVGRRIFSTRVQRWLRRAGGVDLGDLRHTEPVSREFGADRGQPICRWYIDRFLAQQEQKIRGKVLEVAENSYTRRFGGERVTESAVLHATAGNPQATLVGDLQSGEGIPEQAYDAAILTQVLQCVFDVGPAVRTIHRALVPGGTALVTVPAIAPVSQYDVERWGEYWHFTPQSVARLFEPVFGAENVRVTAFGNSVVAHAYLAGMAAEELHERELLPYDPDFPIVIAAVATRR